jgi:hypothetical protein
MLAMMLMVVVPVVSRMMPTAGGMPGMDRKATGMGAATAG